MSTIPPRNGPARPHTPEPKTTGPGGPQATSTPPQSPSRRPQVPHTVSDARVPHAPSASPRPAPKVMLSPTAPAGRSAAIGLAVHQERAETLHRFSQNNLIFDAPTCAAATPLYNLMSHDEGLKTYFIEVPTAGTFIASHSRKDHADYAENARVGNAGKPLAQHADLATSLFNVVGNANASPQARNPLVAADPSAIAAAQAAGGKVWPAKMWLKSASVHRQSTVQVDRKVDVVGKQGGTRLRMVPGNDKAVLDESQALGYVAPQAAAATHLARFYANVLVGGAHGGEVVRCEAKALPNNPTPTDLRTHQDLLALSAAINQEVDRLTSR